MLCGFATLREKKSLGKNMKLFAATALSSLLLNKNI
jgi:hypothetical protein